jgi:hypothetical protein
MLVEGEAPERRPVPIYVMTPAFNPLSGGIRAMNLLAHTLLRLGYNAYAMPQPEAGDAPPYAMRYLDEATRARHAAGGLVRIALYPEVTAGNPFGADVVVRYLLNRPGLLTPGVEATYGADDIFLAFDADHLPPGRSGVDLFMPLVDRTIYYPTTIPAQRRGVVVFANRQDAGDVATALPAWLARPAQELGNLYRRATAMVTHERSTAIYEALCCGCPVICIASGTFQATTYQRRFERAGMAWAMTRDALAQATASVPRFIALYDDLEASLDRRVRAAFDPIVQRAADAIAATAHTPSEQEFRGRR